MNHIKLGEQQRTLASTLREHDLQSYISNAARANGWLVHHSRPGMMRSGKWATPLQGNPGLPDLILCKPPFLILAELKSQAGRVSQAQQQWLLALGGVPGIKAVIWRPSAWLDGTILRTLKGEA